MELKSLNIKDYHYNSEMISEIGSVFYDRNDNEDDWIEVIPDSLVDNLYIVVIVVGGVNKKVFAFDGDNEQLKKLLSSSLKGLYV